METKKEDVGLLINNIQVQVQRLNQDGPTSGEVDARGLYSTLTFKQGLGTASVTFKPELTGDRFFKTTGRVSVYVAPVMKGCRYAEERRHSKRFAPRKEGWTTARTAEIAAKVLLALKVSAQDGEALDVAELILTHAKNKINEYGVGTTSTPTGAWVGAKIYNNKVTYDLHLPSLDLEQSIQVAIFTNKMLAEPEVP